MATPASDPVARAAGLGSGYAKLWAAAAVSFVGDGIYGTALPLLAATLTRDPLGVTSVEVASQLPWLLFALPAGALVDRWDRRRVLWLTDAYRALVLAALAGAIVAGWASVPLLGAAGFLLAVGGTLFTPATMSIIPGAGLPRPGPAGTGQQPPGRRPDRGRQLPRPTRRRRPVLPGSFRALCRRRPLLRRQRCPAGQHQGPLPGRPRPPARPGRGAAPSQPVTGDHRGPGLACRPVAAAHPSGHERYHQPDLRAWTAIMVLFAQDRLGLGNGCYESAFR
jgi:Transmembrane secretion effector